MAADDERSSAPLVISTTSNWVSYLIAFVFTMSVAGKLIDPSTTLQVLTTVWFFPELAAKGSFLALLSVEVILAALLVMQPRRATFIVAAGFLIVISASIIRQLIEGSTIGCGCGLELGIFSAQTEQIIALAKNLILVALLGPLIFRRNDAVPL